MGVFLTIWPGDQRCPISLTRFESWSQAGLWPAVWPTRWRAAGGCRWFNGGKSSTSARRKNSETRTSRRCSCRLLVAVFLACQVGVVAMIAYGIHLQSTTHCFTNKPFKRRYTVFRPDDPRIERLREMPRHYNQEGTIPNPAPAFNYSGYRYLSQKGDLV